MPFGFARIFDLIADGDAETLLDQTRDAAVCGVKGHAASECRRQIESEREVRVSSSAGGEQGVFYRTSSKQSPILKRRWRRDAAVLRASRYYAPPASPTGWDISL